MTRYLRPVTLAEACEMRASDPELLPVAGATDLMVAVNFGRSDPPGLLDLTHIDELRQWRHDANAVRLGAGVTYTRIIEDLPALAPALAAASRTVGSRQIRNRATLGGNLATASPAGDGLPPLIATGADVELVSTTGTRAVPVAEFFTGPKRTVLRPDELIAAVRIPVGRGPQQFAKVGPRNAMVIAVAAVATVLDVPSRNVAVGVGAAAPKPVRAQAAADFAADHLDWESAGVVGPDVLRKFGALVAQECVPIDDVRSTAAYRRHAVGVLAARTLRWSWDEYRKVDPCD